MERRVQTRRSNRSIQQIVSWFEAFRLVFRGTYWERQLSGAILSVLGCHVDQGVFGALYVYLFEFPACLMLCLVSRIRIPL